MTKDEFMARVRVLESGCWEWTGATTSSKGQRGYGMFRLSGKTQLAHRFGYELFREKLPDGAMALHECDNKWCANPWHIEPGDNSKNIRDAYSRLGIKSWNARKTHCTNCGGEYAKNKAGRRICLPCRAAMDRQRRAKRASRGGGGMQSVGMSNNATGSV